MSRRPREILVRPIFTEETSRLEAEPGRVRKRHEGKIEPKGRKYVFEVAPDANKIDIRRAVEELFEVEVKSVRTMNCIGKMRRMGRTTGRRPHWKKAIVTLVEDAVIDMYEGA